MYFSSRVPGTFEEPYLRCLILRRRIHLLLGLLFARRPMRHGMLLGA